MFQILRRNKPAKSQAMIIAIGGVSTAGKTTLAKQLREHFHDYKVITLCQDDFVKPVDEIPVIQNRVDWEHPDSIDHERFMSAIIAEKNENDIVIAEGLMIYWHQPLLKYFDKRIFVEVDHATFLHRKAKDNRWGHEPDWYINHIWKNYLLFGKPPENESYLSITGNWSITLKPILAYLKS